MAGAAFTHNGNGGPMEFSDDDALDRVGDTIKALAKSSRSGPLLSGIVQVTNLLSEGDEFAAAAGSLGLEVSYAGIAVSGADPKQALAFDAFMLILPEGAEREPAFVLMSHFLRERRPLVFVVFLDLGHGIGELAPLVQEHVCGLRQTHGLNYEVYALCEDQHDPDGLSIIIGVLPGVEADPEALMEFCTGPLLTAAVEWDEDGGEQG